VKAKEMTGNQLNLSTNQEKYFDRFLLASTGKILNALESLFALEINSSNSNIEIVPAVDIQNAEPLNSGSLYVISSKMTGELRGSFHLLIRSSDFMILGEVMKPLLKLLFLSNTDSNFATQESQKPDWMIGTVETPSDDAVFIEQLTDALTEMSNVLFGVYSGTLYDVYDLHTSHTVPDFLGNIDQASIQKIFSSPELLDRQHLIIENDFIVFDHLFELWCLVSPTQKSFQEILNRIG
jgi:chemotaxis protein CheY-P-specific phosphatase CheC